MRPNSCALFRPNPKTLNRLQVSSDSTLRNLNCSKWADMASKMNSSRRTIAVDFDGVIAEYIGWRGNGVLGAPRPDVVKALGRLRSEGWKVIVHSARGEDEIAGYLVQHGIPHDEINRNSDYQTSGAKPVADVYWDDRAVCYSGDAQRDIESIRSFRTWSGRQ